MKPIGQEHAFSDLLINGDPIFHPAMLARRPKSVLDIGTENGEGLYLLYHIYDFIERLDGWEKETADDVLARLKNCDRRHNRVPTYNTLYERYRWALGRLEGGRPIIQNEEDYRRIINVRYSTNCLTAPLKGRKYDFIIASNILHLLHMDEISPFLHKVRAAMEQDALLYFHFNKKAADSEDSLLEYEKRKEAVEHFNKEWGWNLHKRERVNAENGWTHITYTNLFTT